MRALACLLGLLAAFDGGAGTLELRSGQNDYSLIREIDWAVDANAQWSLSDVQAGRANLQPFSGNSLTFGFDRRPHWLGGEIFNRDHRQSKWVFLIEYTLLDNIELYVVDSRGKVTERASGDLRPFSSRDMNHRHFNFVLDIPPRAKRTFYLRIQSKSSLQVPIRLLTPEALAAVNYRSQLGFGLLYGIFLALISYNLILFLAVRDRTFLYYVLYVAAFVGLQLALNGFAFQYLWPEQPRWANIAIVFLLPVALVAMFQFCRSFLNLAGTGPRENRLFVALMWLCVLLAALSFVVDYRVLILVETGLVFVAAALIVFSGVRSALAGYQPARYFLLAWGVLILGILAYASVSFGLLPKIFITEYGMQIGSAAEMILLSFALAYRINVSQELNRRKTQEMQTTLEFRVRERTQELNEALQRLEQANRSLQQSSERDGLTGVYNRRYLDDAIKAEWARAIDSGKPIALIVLDLDHFKEVNDRRGHLAGDDGLRAVAAALGETLEPVRCILARFGGEEFFVVLPEFEVAEAAELAEKLRRAVADLQILSEDQSFYITASFGVAALKPGGGRTYRDLIRSADQAMYEAKKQGRNRVVLAD